MFYDLSKDFAHNTDLSSHRIILNPPTFENDSDYFIANFKL